MIRYIVRNYGNTRKLPYKGLHYEITKNGSIETEDKKLAGALGEFPFVDVQVIEQSLEKVSKKKKVFNQKKTTVAIRKHKKIKRSSERKIK